MKSKLNTYLIYIVSTILVLLLSALSFLVYQSYQYKTQTATLVAEAALSAHRRTSVSSVRAALSGAQSDIKTIESRFIKESDVPGFISSIEKLGADVLSSASIVSVDLDRIEVKVPKKTEVKPTAPAPRNLRMRIEGTGSWYEVVRFIAALEAMPSAISIQSMSLSKTVPPAETPQATWRLSVDIIQFVSN